MTISYTCTQFSGYIFDWAILSKPYKYNVYFMMTFQQAKQFVGTRGEQCSKNSFLFSYIFNTKSSCFSQKIKPHGTKVQHAKIRTDSELTCDG